ncbi:hypothetical protein EZV73_26420 [Acidaminobacter sp. JC074]|nr:hypothetical protein [Acidaminobacter sp. JC074]
MSEVFFDLSFENYIGGPEEDRDRNRGDICKFKYLYNGIRIYIKINYCPPEDMIIISFHEDEKNHL